VFALFATMYAGPDPGPADEEAVQQWIRAARVGNARAARQLYAVHVARVFRAVRPLCSSDADAEDVTQDAFIDALSNLNRYAPRAGTRFVGWLLTLALNRARKRKAHAAKTEVTSPETMACLHDASASDSPEDAQLRKRALLQALAELPERDRRVICLRYGAELTAEEVEEVTRVSAANVRKICERQRKALLERLEGRK
jgi:RNA polymerase sigma-70 factor (ECF subfamily)